MHELILLSAVIILAVCFDFINGFHDTANAIATVVSTRVLTPIVAILMAAGLNFLGALSGTAVAKTIGSGIVGTSVSQEVVIAALIGAIIWNLITWYLGIPSSSSHALIGGLVGGGIAQAGLTQVNWAVLMNKVLLPLVGSPLVGFIGGYIIMNILIKLFANFSPSFVGRFFRQGQVLSSAFMAFSHGSNDAQKTMGIITLALISAHQIPAAPFHVPLWVIVLSASAMAFGTASGGWRIIHTMGTKLVHLTPIHGFAAETSAATIIEIASRFGFPLSTTHVISSTILGVGASKRFKSVRWIVARGMIQTWIFTIPATVTISFISYSLLIKLF
ncbi:MAG: inorganic phosphate transporter [Candidatus Daviesbacteria bacterium]|nr:inorganic phosphate transporter [Candidatus Daviesbacteria bacterium]